MNWYKEHEKTEGKSGIGTCAAIEEATEMYRSDNDQFSKFIKDCIVEIWGSDIPAQELYETYKDWCQDMGESNPSTQASFSRQLKEREILKKRTSKGNVYEGICLKVGIHKDDSDF